MNTNTRNLILEAAGFAGESVSIGGRFVIQDHFFFQDVQYPRSFHEAQRDQRCLDGTNGMDSTFEKH
jgi:hypothetical protein